MVEQKRVIHTTVFSYLNYLFTINKAIIKEVWINKTLKRAIAYIISVDTFKKNDIKKNRTADMIKTKEKFTKTNFMNSPPIQIYDNIITLSKQIKNRSENRILRPIFLIFNS